MLHKSENKVFIAADIGGTHSRFALFCQHQGILRLERIEILLTDRYDSFAALWHHVRGYCLPDVCDAADAVVLACAGPISVDGRTCNPPLIKWTVDLSVIDNAKAYLINDFEAQAFAVGSPIGAMADLVIPGIRDVGNKSLPCAVIGAGTGFGKALYIPNANGAPYVVQSEGGHTNVAIESSKDWDLYQFAVARLGVPYLTWNDLVSGSGLSIIHEYCYSEAISPADISSRLLSYPRTLEVFSDFYGRVGRNYALECLPLGGLFVAGGIAARNPEVVTHDGFRRAFLRSFHHSALLGQISVYLMTDQASGLWGAARYAEVAMGSMNE